MDSGCDAVAEGLFSDAASEGLGQASSAQERPTSADPGPLRCSNAQQFTEDSQDPDRSQQHVQEAPCVEPACVAESERREESLPQRRVQHESQLARSPLSQLRYSKTSTPTSSNSRPWSALIRPQSSLLYRGPSRRHVPSTSMSASLGTWPLQRRPGRASSAPSSRSGSPSMHGATSGLEVRARVAFSW